MLDDESGDHHDDGTEELGSTSSALSASDPVSSAVSQACSTTAVKGLATQLVEEINCMKPGSMKRIDGVSGLSLGSAVFPYLQTPAANALVAAQKARGVTMSLNSGLRTLPQQYLLYRWYQTGRCGIGLAARPGTSNHESGIAVDINDNASWRSAMNSKKFRWLGASDPVHFDFIGSGTINMKGESVRAFQRLWNRNNPSDKIVEDGAYGPATEARLAKSPVGGFAKGAFCIDNANANARSAPGAGGDELPSEMGDDGESDVPMIPDATEPETETSTPSLPSTSESKETKSAQLDGVDLPDGSTPAAGGCSMASESGAATSSVALVTGALALMLSRRRRRTVAA